MLTVTVETPDGGSVDLDFEHSLLSVSAWEARHGRAFFSKEPMSKEEQDAYLRDMLLTKNPPENFRDLLSYEDMRELSEYINSKQSATFIAPPPKGRGSNEVWTSEVIYYQMIHFKIPFQPCESWHLNRLMILIQICGIKQTKPKKMSKQALAEQYRTLNAQRKAQLGTTG